MKLTPENDVAVAVEINGELVINSANGKLYQNIEDNEIFLYITSDFDQKEIKIRITNNKSNKIITEDASSKSE